MAIEGRIAGLFVYPVKGCAGIALREALLTPRGLAHDRRWMIVGPDGRFLSQRELPRLARIRPALVEAALRLALGGEVELLVPDVARGAPLPVRVWGDTVEALAVDPALDRALSDWLGREVRLVRFPESGFRPCDPTYAPPGSHTAFADGFPLLVTSEGSLAELNVALSQAGAAPVPMDRFRPNLVLAGVPARAEDESAAIRLEGGTRLGLVKRCDRCVVTTIDQSRGERTGKEPLATLARIRRNVPTGGAWFGQNAVPLLADGGVARLRVGQGCTLVQA
ncbi:MOSC domain-containing protein [Benzoatithermus flavus]|uniref:MOSC N-terminal beta barrel domain-containing protein n=1 Tax=Benzoatithermus flavus TaxID=3108223 RepID=A0ABU8XYK1_9PROT